MEKEFQKNHNDKGEKLSWEETQEETQREPSPIIKKILSIIIFFGAINLLLWGGQEIYYRNDTKKINEIEAYLKNEEQTINALRDKINLTEAEIGRKESQLNSFKSLGYIDEYNAGVGDFNSLLNTYKQDLDTYDSKLTSYNAKVDEANTLIKKSGSRWYLIPIPLPSKNIKSKL